MTVHANLSITLGAALLLAVGCTTPQLGAPFRGAVLDVVDMHLHFGQWHDIPPETQQVLAGNFPFPLGLDAEGTAASQTTAEGVLAQLDGAGVRRGMLFAVYAPRSVGIATNEQAVREVAKFPERLVGLASLRLDRWNRDAQVELDALQAALSEPGMVGIKLAHAHQHVRFDDPAYFGIYEVAEAFDAPVYLHTGLSPFRGTSQEAPYTDAAYVETAIEAYPNVRFILGHMGHDFEPDFTEPLDTVLDLALRYDNVLLEPSALSDDDDFRLPFALQRVKELGLVERTIWGSDGPQAPGFVGRYLQKTLQAMEDADYSVDEAQAVLADNFDRVFAP
ncbi:MAG: amidohydrolase family protein [Myxococcales bacterium]|nr:amidohydrolase family protein [Myxococcales bacterium]